MRVAAVDIGTNSTRLLVADARDGILAPVFRTTTITRLGQGVDANRRIDEQAMARTLAVLEGYAQKIQSFGASRIGTVATSACRDAENREEFFERVRDVLGAPPELLSGRSEAVLSFAGAISAWEGREAGPFLVVDIGGGSTELAVGVLDPAELRPLPKTQPEVVESHGRLVDFPGVRLEGWTSLDIGCVRITERFLHSDPPSPHELSEALRAIDANLVLAEREVPIRDAKRFVGLAGTLTSLAAMDLGLEVYDPDRVHHHRLSRKGAEELFRYLASTTREELRSEPGLEPMRADVIVGGTAILIAMFRRWHFFEVVVSEADILDGVALATSLGLVGADAV